MQVSGPTIPDERYVVSLDIFEGPLDLLLHLIRRHEIDVFDIPISFITSKYLEYLDLMKELDLDVAAEYLEMAATLTYIKSRMLVPSDGTEEDDGGPEVEGPDPREELVRQLLEYQKYKLAAEALAERPQQGRDTFTRDAAVELSDEDRDLASPGLFALLEALQEVLERTDADQMAEISVTRISITARIHQLLDRLRADRRLMFADLFAGQVTRSDVVVTFLAILETTKLGLTRIHQAGDLGEIHISVAAGEDETARVLAEHNLEDE